MFAAMLLHQADSLIVKRSRLAVIEDENAGARSNLDDRFGGSRIEVLGN